MKKFENKSGSFMVSGDIEIDTDDMIDDLTPEKKKELKIQQEKLEHNRLIEDKNSEEEFSKSNCLVHLYFHSTNSDDKISGTLEKYKMYSTTTPGTYTRYLNRLIELWVGYDTLATMFNRQHLHVEKITLEHLSGSELPIGIHKMYMTEVEISEINGPLFKVKILLTHTT